MCRPISTLFIDSPLADDFMLVHFHIWSDGRGERAYHRLDGGFRVTVVFPSPVVATAALDIMLARWCVNRSIPMITKKVLMAPGPLPESQVALSLTFRSIDSVT